MPPRQLYSIENNVVNTEKIKKLRTEAARRGQNISIVDPAVDNVWGSYNVQDPNNTPNPFYDYYYSAEDIKVHVAEIPRGAAVRPEFQDLPMVSLGFNIKQNKKPVYGYWDYLYASVMYGNKIVMGTFTITTPYPNYMIDLLSEIGNRRAKQTSGYNDYAPQYTETQDKLLVQKYWGSQNVAANKETGKDILRVHPPFGLVIDYGFQDVSAQTLNADGLSSFFDTSQKTNFQSQDTNHRLVRSPKNYSSIAIDNIQIDSVEYQYAPTGEPLTETYTFFARNVYTV